VTLKNGIPYCDECHGELVRLSEEEALNNMRPMGWTNYRTATAHYCFDCYDMMFDRWADEVGFPACGECETFPCKRGRDCWDHRDPPFDWIPYETYFSDIVGKVEYVDVDCDFEELIPHEVTVRQEMRKASHHIHQMSLATFLTEVRG
jgi:hypothetical protein